MDHRADCQLLTVPTYGLCTCDFKARMAAPIVVVDNSVPLGMMEFRYDGTVKRIFTNFP